MAKLWKVDLALAQRRITQLGEAGIMRHATLESGAMWCVPTRTFVAALQHVFHDDIPIMHAAVLAVYEDQPNFTSWQAVKDDGFIILQLLRHLAATKRCDEIRCACAAPVL
jgi:protein gp37